MSPVVSQNGRVRVISHGDQRLRGRLDRRNRSPSRRCRRRRRRRRRRQRPNGHADDLITGRIRK